MKRIISERNIDPRYLFEKLEGKGVFDTDKKFEYETYFATIQWILSYNYIERCLDNGLFECEDDKVAFEIMKRYALRNCKKVYSYIEQVLTYISKNQTDLELDDCMLAMIYVKSIQIVCEMFYSEEIFYFIMENEKKELEDFCVRFLEDAEIILQNSQMPDEEKNKVLCEIKKLHQKFFEEDISDDDCTYEAVIQQCDMNPEADVKRGEKMLEEQIMMWQKASIKDYVFDSEKKRLECYEQLDLLFLKRGLTTENFDEYNENVWEKVFGLSECEREQEIKDVLFQWSDNIMKCYAKEVMNIRLNAVQYVLDCAIEMQKYINDDTGLYFLICGLLMIAGSKKQEFYENIRTFQKQDLAECYYFFMSAFGVANWGYYNRNRFDYTNAAEIIRSKWKVDDATEMDGFMDLLYAIQTSKGIHQFFSAR